MAKIKLSEFAERTGQEVNTVRQWRRRGHIPAVKEYGIWLVDEALIDDFTPPAERTEENVLTLAEYARHIGVGTSALRMRIQNGTLPEAYKDDRGWWVVPRSVIDDEEDNGHVSGGISVPVADF